MGLKIGNILGGAGSILGGIFGNKSAKSSAADMERIAQMFAMDPKARAWAQNVLANPGSREADLTNQLQSLSGHAIDDQQTQGLNDFNAAHAARFSMGGGSGGAGPSATKFLNMTKALANARSDAQTSGAMQARSTVFGEQSAAADFLKGNPEAMAALLGQASNMRSSGRNNMISGISGGLGQMFAPQQQAEAPPWYEQYQKAAVMGQGQPTGPSINQSPTIQAWRAQSNTKLNKGKAYF